MAESSACDRTVSIVQTVRLLTPPDTSDARVRKAAQRRIACAVAAAHLSGMPDDQNPRCAKSVPRRAETARDSVDAAGIKQPLSWAFADTMGPDEAR
jgi:hypothetical protein